MGGFFHATIHEILAPKVDHSKKQILLGAALVGVGTVIGALSPNIANGIANGQCAPPSVQSGDARWHLPKFGEQGWFLHAKNEKSWSIGINSLD